MLGENKAFPRAERGEVTLSSEENWEAAASQKVRNVSAYFPYGYVSLAPVGEEVLLIPAADGVAAIGVKAGSGGLSAGEIRISSKGGASIELKNDGSIILNKTVIIDSEGGISGGAQIN